MNTQIKWITTAILVFLLGGTATAQQKDLNLAHVSSLKKAYAYVQAKDYEAAEKLYKQIQVEKDAKPDVMQAAAEGEGLAILLALNAFIEKSNESDGFLIRSKKRKIVSQLKKASTRYPSEALAYMYALVQEQGDISDKTFAGLALESEYIRLTEKPIEVAVVEESNQEEAKPVIKNIVRAKYIANNTVNIRKGPGREFEVLDQLPKGKVVTVYGTTKVSNGDVWFKLKDDNNSNGYVLAKLFTKSKSNTKTKVVKNTSVKASSGSSSCSGRVKKSIFIPKGKVVKHKPSPNSRTAFTYSKQARIQIYNVVNGYNVVRLSAKGGRIECGYIKRSN